MRLKIRWPRELETSYSRAIVPVLVMVNFFMSLYHGSNLLFVFLLKTAVNFNKKRNIFDHVTIVMM